MNAHNNLLKKLCIIPLPYFSVSIFCCKLSISTRLGVVSTHTSRSRAKSVLKFTCNL